MANPSTGFGGAGTEVLRRSYLNSMSDTEATILTGVANHIYTILSVVFVELSNADELVHMYVDVDLGGTNISLLEEQSVGAKQTFIWNDRFVMTETDRLHALTVSAGNIDVYCSYIDQQLA